MGELKVPNEYMIPTTFNLCECDMLCGTGDLISNPFHKNCWVIKDTHSHQLPLVSVDELDQMVDELDQMVEQLSHFW